MHEHLANRGQHLQVLVTDFRNDGAGETAQLAAWLEACGCRVTREFGSSQEHYTCGWIALDVADKTLRDIDAGDRFEQAVRVDCTTLTVTLHNVNGNVTHVL